MTNRSEKFREIVNRRSPLYESVEIQTVAIEQDSDWYNLHTDVHLCAETPDNLSGADTEILGPAAYFHEVVDFDELWDLIEDIFSNEYVPDEDPIIYSGLSTDDEEEEHWKENVHRAHDSGFERSDKSYGILVQSNSSLTNKDAFKEEIRKLDPPYYSIRDLCKEYLGHTSHRWSKPWTQFFAPLYVQVTENRITEGGNLKFAVRTPDSIQEPVVSSWAHNKSDIIDRARHQPSNPKQLDGPFVKFEIDWRVDGNPTHVSTSIFHSIFGEQQKTTRFSYSTPVIALGAVLGVSSKKVSDYFDQIFQEPNKKQLDNAEFSNDFEATVITLFSLAGFSAYSPEWFEHEFNKGALPDMLAFSVKYNTLIVCECTLSPKDNTIREKVDDALASTQAIEERFDEIDRSDPIIIPVCAAPTDTVSPKVLDDDVEMLTGPVLKEMRETAAETSDPADVMKVWDTYNEQDRFNSF